MPSLSVTVESALKTLISCVSDYIIKLAVWAAVTAVMYEEIVKSVLGLYIYKARVVVFTGENLVNLMITPYTKYEYPVLSNLFFLPFLYNSIIFTQQHISGKLYGNAPFDFAVLLNCKVIEQLRTLKFLIYHFKLFRRRYRIIFISQLNTIIDSLLQAK